MHTPTYTRPPRRLCLAGALAAVLTLLGLAVQPLAMPAAARQPDVAVELCAKEGTVVLPGATSTPIWGFATKPSGVPCDDPSVVAGLPGPVIEANVNQVVELTVTNVLTRPVSLDLPGIELDPGPTEADPDGTVTYSFTAAKPGTYLYESGADAGRQAAMGLYGALVIRPSAAGQAYDDASTAFDREAVAVLSEIDRSFNLDPLSYDLLEWKPTYWLIDGKAYPDTDTICATPGDRVLLRYANPGPETVTMTMLGAHARMLGADAYPLTDPFDIVAQTFPAGGTADALVTLPSSATAGDRFPVYNRQLHVTNGSLANPQHSPGGMMTFIEVNASCP